LFVFLGSRLREAFAVELASVPETQPSGGISLTIPPHLGQACTLPTSEGLQTFSLVVQLLQRTVKGFI